jgi:SNF2 family DNA or RNA helicase
MGLGKTIETISLIITSRAIKLKSSDRSSFPSSAPFRTTKDLDYPEKGDMYRSQATLIVCPLSTIHNWEEQFSSHVKPGTVNMVVHHGTGRMQNADQLSSFVIFTLFFLFSPFLLCIHTIYDIGYRHHHLQRLID